MKGSNYIYNDFLHTTVPIAIGSVWDKGYRYGFNSMEKDNEINVNGGSYDFGARIYDSRLGRWLSLDPLMEDFPDLSPYNFCEDNPIFYIDPDGKKPGPYNNGRNYRSNNLGYLNNVSPRTFQTNTFRLKIQNNNSNNRSSVTRNGNNDPNYKPSNSAPPIRPALIHNNAPHDGGQNTSGTNANILDLILTIRDITLDIISIRYHYTTVTNHKGIASTTLSVTLSDMEQQSKLDKLENNYQKGLQDAKNKYIKDNKPIFDSEKYNQITKQEDKQVFKKNYEKKLNEFNSSLNANLAGVTIKYTINNGKSPYQLLKDKALQLKKSGLMFELETKGEKRTESVIYPTK